MVKCLLLSPSLEGNDDGSLEKVVCSQGPPCVEAFPIPGFFRIDILLLMLTTSCAITLSHYAEVTSWGEDGKGQGHGENREPFLV